MNRRKASIRNTVIALTSEILVTVVGFMLPRAIMVNYGSETNGLITSLQQFIQYFTLLEAGLSGAAVLHCTSHYLRGIQEQLKEYCIRRRKCTKSWAVCFSL